LNGLSDRVKSGKELHFSSLKIPGFESSSVEVFAAFESSCVKTMSMKIRNIMERKEF
jgi:hypothetical protein